MCDNSVSENPYSPQYVPDWLLALQGKWFEDFDNDDKLIAWCNDYKQQR